MILKSPQEILKSTKAGNILKEDYIVLSPSDLATRAREVIRSEEIRVLPVVEDRKLKGVLSAQDLLKITSTSSNVKVSGLMETPPIFGTPDWDLAELFGRAVEFDVYDIPIIEGSEDKTFRGMVRIENILNEIVDCCGDEPKVEEIMTREVLVTHPGKKLSSVWNKMEESNISGVPVAKKEKPIGMITRLDILKFGKARLALESEGGRDPPKVEIIMTSPVVTVAPEDSIGKSVKIMRDNDIGRLPVTKDERLIGIIDREDIIRTYL